MFYDIHLNLRNSCIAANPREAVMRRLSGVPSHRQASVSTTLLPHAAMRLILDYGRDYGLNGRYGGLRPESELWQISLFIVNRSWEFEDHTRGAHARCEDDDL
jgi:hypothetical protein